MRVLYFTRDYTTHDHRYLTALANTEYKIYYLRLEQSTHKTDNQALPPDIEPVPWVGGNRPYHWQDAPRLYKDLKRVISEIKPNLVHAGPIQTCAFLCALNGFHPLVSMSWGYDLLQDAQRDPLNQRITRYTLRHTDVLVGDCDTVRQKAIELGMDDERIVTYPWGIDLEHFNFPVEKATNGSSFTLISTRGWEPIYGVDVIAHAFVQAVKQRPELRLVMLGDGSQSDILRMIFADGGVLDHVDLPGQVNQADLPDFYQSANLYIAASHSDGTSISLLEAMACGCPVLVSDIPGNREWITPGVQGWLFKDGDVNALTRAIVRAYDDRSLLPEMGRSSRSLVEERADWNKNFPQLLEAYQLALQFVE